MAITSKRETILDYLRKTTLIGIDGAGNYNLEINFVSREFLLPDQVSSFDVPCIFILDDFATSYSQMTAQQYSTGNNPGAMDDGMAITLVGYCSVDREIGTNQRKLGGLSTEMNKLHSDLIVAMHADTSLGGNCLGLALLSSVNSLEFIEADIGVVLQTYSIKYDFNPSASTPTT